MLKARDAHVQMLLRAHAAADFSEWPEPLDIGDLSSERRVAMVTGDAILPHPPDAQALGVRSALEHLRLGHTGTLLTLAQLYTLRGSHVHAVLAAGAAVVLDPTDPRTRAALLAAAVAGGWRDEAAALAAAQVRLLCVACSRQALQRRLSTTRLPCTRNERRHLTARCFAAWASKQDLACRGLLHLSAVRGLPQRPTSCLGRSASSAASS